MTDRIAALILLACAVAVGAVFGLAACVIGLPAADADTAQHDRVYQTHCYANLRAAHPEVPHSEDSVSAYLEWVAANPEQHAQWIAQVRQCPTGQWNWGSMVRVG